MSEYHLIPTRYPNTRMKRKDGKTTFEYVRPKPDGWVTLGANTVVKDYYDDNGVLQHTRTQYKGILGPTRRTITPGYIRQRINRNVSIEESQNYVKRIITNPRTPAVNRQVALQFVIDNPTMFIPVAEGDPDTEYGRWARMRNGRARFGFVKDMIEEARRFQ